MTELQTGIRIRVELEGSWRYRGRIVDSDDKFITINEEFSLRPVMIRKDQILRLEVLP